MMSKKAQAQIITTVLIILLVLAAIVIVWQVVSGTIEGGGEQISAQSSCIGVTMEVTDAVVAGTTATVRRGQGSTETKVTGYKLFVNGALDQTVTVDLDPLDTNTATLTAALAAGDKVSVAAVVGDTVCSASGDYVATTA